MKQISSILFSFIAVFVILAHSITPHHYHEDIVCLESKFNSEEDHDLCCHEHHIFVGNHNHSDEDHHQDAKDSSCKCILNTIDFVVSTQIKTECKTLDHKGIQNNKINLQTVLDQLFNLEYSQHKILFSGQPLILQHKLTYTRNYSFRAPPLA